MTPTKKSKIYWQGQNAFHNQMKLEDNPYYHSKDGELSEWNRGYYDAQDGIEDPFPEDTQTLPDHLDKIPGMEIMDSRWPTGGIPDETDNIYPR